VSIAAEVGQPRGEVCNQRFEEGGVLGMGGALEFQDFAVEVQSAGVHEVADETGGMVPLVAGVSPEPGGFAGPPRVFPKDRKRFGRNQQPGAVQAEFHAFVEAAVGAAVGPRPRFVEGLVEAGRHPLAHGRQALDGRGIAGEGGAHR
jgi:hypothetical protein